jgi:hypothetical protein
MCCGLSFFGYTLSFNGNFFTNFTLPSSEISARKAQNIGTLGLGAHGHRRIQIDELCLSCMTSTKKGVHLLIFILISSFHEKGCITFTKKRVHLFIFIFISWERVHYIRKETGSSFHFHPHFMWKHALHAQRNNTFFIFIPISWESVHYIHKERGLSFHFHLHFMRKCALHAQRNKYIFSSSFLEKVCIMCTKKWIYLFIFTFISRKSAHYMGENVFHGESCILFEPFSIFISKLKWIHLILIFLLVYCCGNSWLYVFSWMYLKHN